MLAHYTRCTILRGLHPICHQIFLACDSGRGAPSMVCTWCGRSWACKWFDALKPVETSDPPMSNKEAQATTWKGCRIGHFDRTPAGRSLVLQERGCGSELLSHRHCIGRRPQRTTVFEPVFKVIWAWVPKYLCTKYLMVACIHVSWDISRWACDQFRICQDVNHLQLVKD